MSDLYREALAVAKSYDVSTAKDSLVLYSVSFLPSKENKDKAFAYVANHKGSCMIEQTQCGSKLLELGVDSDCLLSEEEKVEIWKTASRRMIDSASGNITVFVDGADSRSVFCTVELPEILVNDKITTINGIDKQKFSRYLIRERY